MEFSANVLKPSLDKKKTVAIPEVDDFDDQVSVSLFGLSHLVWET